MSTPEPATTFVRPKSTFRPGSIGGGLGGLILALIVIFVCFIFLAPNHKFATAENIETILRQSVITALVAIGSAYVIISGGIDLSVGSTAATSCVLVSWVLAYTHFGPLMALVVGIIGGAIFGFLNGVLVTLLGVGPFIVTLASYLIVRAIGLGIAHDETISPNVSTWLDHLLDSVGKKNAWQLLPWGVWTAIFFMVLMGLVLRYTRFGRHVVAVGSNESAARLCGVPVNRTKLMVYCLSGAFAGLAGVMLFSRLSIGDPTAADGLELEAIAAVVIGGASLTGGEGSIVGAVIGALIMQTIRSGGSQMGLPNWVQKIVTGTIILIAVALDRWRIRRNQNVV